MFPRNKFDSFQVPNLTTDPAVLHDIHCVASVLKLYFRDLPTPLVTYDLYPHLVLASKTSEHVRVEKYKEILLRLPQSHYRYYPLPTPGCPVELITANRGRISGQWTG